MAEQQHNKNRPEYSPISKLIMREEMMRKNASIPEGELKWDANNRDHQDQFTDHLANGRFRSPLNSVPRPRQGFMDDVMYKGKKAADKATGFASGLYDDVKDSVSNGMSQTAGSWDEQMEKMPAFMGELFGSGLISEQEHGFMKSLMQTMNRESIPLGIPGRRPSGDMPGVYEGDRGDFNFGPNPSPMSGPSSELESLDEPRIQDYTLGDALRNKIPRNFMDRDMSKEDQLYRRYK